MNVAFDGGNQTEARLVDGGNTASCGNNLDRKLLDDAERAMQVSGI